MRCSIAYPVDRWLIPRDRQPWSGSWAFRTTSPAAAQARNHRLGKAREAGASEASARGVQMPLHAREVVESTIY
jgi:hypothetical protein